VIAALYVESGGAYFGLDGVGPGGEARDARTYKGPHPVVAHPPCQRWGGKNKTAIRNATPGSFRDVLLSIARSCGR
jgi:hypothetical protein